MIWSLGLRNNLKSLGEAKELEAGAKEKPQILKENQTLGGWSLGKTKKT